MVAQLEKAATEHTNRPDVVLQLVAVLALLRELRALEKTPRWMAIKEELVPNDDLVRVLEEAFRHLFGRDFDLYAAITSALGDERFDELSRLKGLLIWLCWECEVRINDKYGLAEEADEVWTRIVGKAYLVQLAQMLPEDEVAYAEARSSILRVIRGSKLPRASLWLNELQVWSNNVVSRLRAFSDDPLPIRRTAIGELALAPIVPKRLRVVTRVADGNVSLFDFGPDSAEITFRRDKVATLSPITWGGAAA
jgi:hypothetical protein